MRSSVASQRFLTMLSSYWDRRGILWSPALPVRENAPATRDREVDPAKRFGEYSFLAAIVDCTVSAPRNTLETPCLNRAKFTRYILGARRGGPPQECVTQKRIQ